MDAEFWISFLHILMIDLVLSSDNAVVIGIACCGLAPRERRRAVWYGIIGAVLLRVGLTGMATWIMDIPLVKVVGGLLLLWIAFKLMADGEEETVDVAYSKDVRQAVKTIILADFVMSLDNVLAVGGAAHGDMWLVLFGLGFSIPLLMWGSTIVAKLINRFPVLLYAGVAILAFTAGEMCVEDLWELFPPLPDVQTWIPAVMALGVLLLGRLRKIG